MASWLARARACGSSSSACPSSSCWGRSGISPGGRACPPVRVEFQPVPQFIGARTPITLVLRATRGGVESVDIRLIQGGTRVTSRSRPSRAAPPATSSGSQLIVEGGTLGLREGAATLEVRARDGFWRPLRVDDRMIANLPVTLDFTPPTLESPGLDALSLPGRRRAGRAARPGRRAGGVNVGDVFFPGFPAGARDTGLHAVLSRCRGTWRRNAPVTATAQDEAGNAVSRGSRWTSGPRSFPMDTIERERAVPREQDAGAPSRDGQIAPASSSPAFLRMNRDKRKEAEEMKGSSPQTSQPRPSSRAPSSSRATRRCSPTSRRRAPTATRARTWTPRCTWATTWRH